MEILLLLLILTLAAVLQAESELIKYRTWECFFPLAPWYIENIWDYTSKGKVVDWLMRYPLSFLKDGFHATKSLSIILLMVAVSLSIPMFTNVFANVIFLYVIYGTAFNFRYHKWYQLIFKKRK